MSAPGTATRDAENWTAEFKESKERVKSVQKMIFEAVPQAMRGSASRLMDQLERHRKQPTPESRRQLMAVTTAELGAIGDALAPIVGEGDEVLLEVTEMESRVLQRAAGLRAAVE